jgi:plastocyanin
MRRLLVLLFAVTTLATACGGDEPEGPVTVVGIENRTFAPVDVTVAPGSVIEWRNTDAEIHNVVSLELDGLKALKIDPGGTYRFTVEEIGQFRYYCSLHATQDGKGQWGTIVVR